MQKPGGKNCLCQESGSSDGKQQHDNENIVVYILDFFVSYQKIKRREHFTNYKSVTVFSKDNA